MKMAKMWFHDADIIFGPIPKARKARSAVKRFFDFSPAINTGYFSEVVDFNGFPQVIIERDFLMIQSQKV